MIQVSFDEFNLDILATYRGQMLELPTIRPDEQELLTDPRAGARLAGYLVRNYADKITAFQEGGPCRIDLHFDH